MPNEILKFSKSVNFIDSNEINNAESFTVDHYSDSVQNGESEIPFLITVTNIQPPYLEEVDFSVVVREKVDLTAHGPSEKELKKSEKIKKFSPTELPPGFVELKKMDN